MCNFYRLGLPVLQYNDDFIMRALCQELFSTWIFIAFFLSVTDVKMQFSQEKAINCFILASSYVGCRAMFYGQVYGPDKPATTSYGAVMNPAIALGIAFAGFFGDGWDSWKAIYLYPTIPFGGAILAVIFYELIYKKVIQTLAHLGDGDDMGGVQEEADEGLLDRQNTQAQVHAVQAVPNDAYTDPNKIEY